MNSTNIITIIACVVGSGGLGALISSILSARKYKSEAIKTEQEADQIRKKSNIDEMAWIGETLRKISEDSNTQLAEQKKRNDDLNQRVDELNNKLQLIMEWVIYDNQRYRSWLEDELRKRDPEVEFPKCAPPPKIFQGYPQHEQ